MSVKLVSISQGAGELEGHSAEDVISYCARVSNPNNKLNFDSAPKLLKYCIENAHWSIFEQSNFTVEITTTLAISMQILRHRSFVFQQHSNRYAKSSNYLEMSARSQDTKNRQNSIDNVSEQDQNWFIKAQREVWDLSYELYQAGLAKGLSKESMRFLLPCNTETTLMMTGSVRSWIHYIQLREANGTQLEHRVIAEEIKKIFIEKLPNIAVALKWKD